MHPLLLLLVSPAHAVGGAFAGPIGEDPIPSAGTQVSVAPGDTGNVLVLTVRVARAAEDLAVLWPAEGIVPTSVVTVDPTWFSRLEAITRPVVEELTCDELVAVTHWRTPPGCSSYEQVEPEVLEGEAALTSVSAAPEWADVQLQLEVITPAELPDWLALRELALSPELAVALQPHLDAGEPLLTIRPDRPVPEGTWLPPVRFAVAPGEVVLPLGVGAAAATTRHELHVYGLAGEELPNPVIANFAPGLVRDECVLPEGRDAAAAWLETSRDALEESSPILPYSLEYAGRADRCDPCIEEPLDPFELTTLGFTADPDTARVSRLRMSWPVGRLDADPVVAFAGPPPAEVDLHFYAWDPDLLFAFPACGEDGPGGGGTCPNLNLPGSGCRTTGPASLLGLLLAAVALRRRVRAPLLAVLLMFATRAVAAPPDLGPKTEANVALAVFGTDRLVPQGLDRGAPWIGNPFLGVEVRRSWLALRNGTNVGLMAGVRGWGGRAAPGPARSLATYWLVEPQVGVDIRHGRFREGNPSGRVRYGVLLTLSGLAPSVSPAQFVPSAAVHAGYGWWLGRGLKRTSLELRASVIPRTDGYESRYHPNVGLPGFMFYPGTANLWIVVGRAWY